MKNAWSLLLLVLLVAVAVWAWMPMAPQQPVSDARPLPLLTSEVAGWLNTPQPLTQQELAGQWVVVDMWATWCGPCLQSMPEVAEFRDRWADRGVMVVGVTAETADDVPRIEQVLETIPAMQWPIAYGGQSLFELLQVQGIPTFVLVNPSGQVVYQGHGLDELEQRLKAGLAGS